MTYCTDTRPTDSLLQAAQDADLFIGEGMYGEPEKKEKARENKHMMMQEAAQIAKKANVARFWMTHYSPSLNHPEEFLEEVRNIYPEAVAARDGRTIDLLFDEE